MRRNTGMDKIARVTHNPRQVAVAIATMVTLIATVGAPFKWGFLRVFGL